MKNTEQLSFNKVFDRRTYDKMCQDLRNQNIFEQSSVLCNYSIRIHTQKNQTKIVKWGNNLKVTGPLNFLNIYRNMDQRFWNKYTDDSELKNQITFYTPFRKGDHFIEFKDQFDYLTSRKIDVIHKQGQILVILKWNPFSKYLSNDQKQKSLQILKRISFDIQWKKNWKLNVRVIAIAETEPDYFEKDYFKKHFLTKLQNVIIRKLSTYDLMGCFSQHNVVIINQKGVIQHLSDSISDVTQKVNEILNSEPKDIALGQYEIPQQQKLKLDYLMQNSISQQLSNKFYKNLDRAKTQIKNQPKCTIEQNFQIMMKNGKQQTLISHIAVRICQLEKENKEFQKFMQIIKQDLPERALLITFYGSVVFDQ